jgi:hypothetical protein
MPERHRKQYAPRLKRKRIARIPGYTNEAETAAELGVATRTLRKWRQLGLGPAFTKFGKQIFYRDESRVSWLRSQEVQPVRAACNVKGAGAHPTPFKMLAEGNP